MPYGFFLHGSFNMTQGDINSLAKRVISIEADAMHQMAGDFPADFIGAVEAILKTKGRVIVSGGRKLVAQMSTVAQSVHRGGSLLVVDVGVLMQDAPNCTSDWADVMNSTLVTK